MGISDNAATRAAILARIRKNQGRGGTTPSQAEREAVGSYIAAHPIGSQPQIREDVAARFRERAERMQSTVDEVAHWGEVPQAVARYLHAHDLPKSGSVWPRLAALDWSGAGLALAAREAKGEDLVGVTGCFAALAETGTLMMVSGSDTPASSSLLPETHVAIVPAERIVAHMEDGWAMARAELGQLPRLVNFISGPSRTGDIDQTIVLGAHGPYRVHMVIVRTTGI